MKVTHPSDRTTLQLNPQGRSDVALRRILLAELDIMELNEACLRQQYDVECLHDFRVAVRRSRIVLSRIPDVFSLRDVRRFMAKLSTLSKVSGPCRDLDVLLQHWPEYGDTTLPGYHQIHHYLQQMSANARSDVVAYLSSEHHDRFRNSWRNFLLQPPAVTRMHNAILPASLLAELILGSAVHILNKRLKVIRHGTDDSRLHKLRIVSKRLRYLLDYFLFADSDPAYGELMPELKKLQEVLGVNQDLCVQKSMTISIKKQMTKTGLMTADVNNALQNIKKTIKKRAVKQRVLALKVIKRVLRSDALAGVRQVD